MLKLNVNNVKYSVKKKFLNFFLWRHFYCFVRCTSPSCAFVQKFSGIFVKTFLNGFVCLSFCLFVFCLSICLSIFLYRSRHFLTNIFLVFVYVFVFLFLTLIVWLLTTNLKSNIVQSFVYLSPCLFQFIGKLYLFSAFFMFVNVPLCLSLFE